MNKTLATKQIEKKAQNPAKKKQEGMKDTSIVQCVEHYKI